MEAKGGGQRENSRTSSKIGKQSNLLRSSSSPPARGTTRHPITPNNHRGTHNSRASLHLRKLKTDTGEGVEGVHRISRVTATALGPSRGMKAKKMVREIRRKCTRKFLRRANSKEKNVSSCEPRDLDSSGKGSVTMIYRIPRPR